MAEAGRLYQGRIVAHCLTVINEKPAAQITFDVGDLAPDEITATIWLHEKAISMARAQLKKCGFDPDTQDVELLETQPTLLAGRVVEIGCEDYKGRIQARIFTRDVPQPAQMKEITSMLRAAKGSSAKQTAVTVAPAPDAFPSDDDIPF